jgi:hypothetical protein
MLLDYILQSTALRLDFSTECAPAMMGDFSSEAFMSSMNFRGASLKREAVATDHEWNKYQGQVAKICDRFKNFLNNSIQ